MSKKISSSPHKARPHHGDEAWWYENNKSIDVYIRNGNGTLGVRIRRADLKRWLDKTEQSEGDSE